MSNVVKDYESVNNALKILQNTIYGHTQSKLMLLCFIPVAILIIGLGFYLCSYLGITVIPLPVYLFLGFATGYIVALFKEPKIRNKTIRKTKLEHYHDKKVRSIAEKYGVNFSPYKSDFDNVSDLFLHLREL